MMKKFMNVCLVVFIASLNFATTAMQQQQCSTSAQHATNASFALEWYDTNTCSSPQILKRVLGELKPVCVSAFLPIKIGICQQQLALATNEEEQKKLREQIQNMEKLLQDQWDRDIVIEDTKTSSEPSHEPDEYLAVARSTETGKAIGFAFFAKTSIKSQFDTIKEQQNITFSNGPIERLLQESSETENIYVTTLAVDPTSHKSGVGRALLSSVFAHRPEITSIYLSTSASPTNTNAQHFYEHVGFRHILTTVKKDVNNLGSRVYCFKKN